jgi:hypothetical protein
LASQIFSGEYAEVFQQFSEAYLDLFIDKRAQAAFFADEAEGLDAILKYVSANKLPDGFGCSLIAASGNSRALYSVFQSEELAIRFRLYALLRAFKVHRFNDGEPEAAWYFSEEAAHGRVSAALLGGIVKDLSAELSDRELRDATRDLPGAEDFVAETRGLHDLRQKYEGATLLSPGDRAGLARAAELIVLDGGYQDARNMFACNIDAELLMTALVIMASELADVDIVLSLASLPAVMSFPKGDGHELATDNHGLLLLQDASSGLSFDYFVETLPTYLVLKEGEPDCDEVVAGLKRRYCEGHWGG